MRLFSILTAFFLSSCIFHYLEGSETRLQLHNTSKLPITNLSIKNSIGVLFADTLEVGEKSRLFSIDYYGSLHFQFQVLDSLQQSLKKNVGDTVPIEYGKSHLITIQSGINDYELVLQ